MEDFREEQRRATDAAAAALTRAWQATVSLEEVVTLGDKDRRNIVLRAVAARPGAAPRPVIVKATRDAAYDGAATDVFETSGLAREWTATAFLAEHVPAADHCARFLAGDAARGVLVFEDLGAGHGSLVAPLLKGPADRAAAALAAYAAALGRLHADTLGCAAGHAAIFHRAFPGKASPTPGGGESWRRQTVDRMERLLGGTIPDEIGVVAERIARPGAWFGLVHRDACPDNVLFVDGRARLLDFEFSNPGHVLIDATYWRMGFPTCWCAGRVPDEVRAAMDRAYREALGAALPIALDDRAFAAEMAILLFARLFGSLAWLLDKAPQTALEKDRDWGLSTWRRRILWYLEAAADGARGAGTLGDLGETALRWRADLAARWPECEPLALYPAFAG